MTELFQNMKNRGEKMHLFFFFGIRSGILSFLKIVYVLLRNTSNKRAVNFNKITNKPLCENV